MELLWRMAEAPPEGQISESGMQINVLLGDGSMELAWWLLLLYAWTWRQLIDELW